METPCFGVVLILRPPRLTHLVQENEGARPSKANTTTQEEATSETTRPAKTTTDPPVRFQQL